MYKKIYGSLKKFSESWIGTIIIVLIVINFAYQSFIIPSSSMYPTLKVGDLVVVNKYKYGTPIPHLPWVELPLWKDTDGDGHLISSEGPSRGDIVVFRSPKNYGTHYVKRCVAKGGDILFVKNKDLYINFAMEDNFVKEKYKGYEFYIDKKYGLFVKNPYSKTKTINHIPKINKSTYEELANQSKLMADQKGFESELNSYYNLIDYPNNKNSAVGVEVIADGENKMVRIPANEYFMMGDNRENSNDSRFWGTVKYKLIEGTVSLIWMSVDKEKYSIRFNRILSLPK